MSRSLVCRVLGTLSLLVIARSAAAGYGAVSLPYFQDWSTTGPLLQPNYWGNVPGVRGFDGADPYTSLPFYPNSPVALEALGNEAVYVNGTNPNSPSPGPGGAVGVQEFALPDRVVALRPSRARTTPR